MRCGRLLGQRERAGADAALLGGLFEGELSAGRRLGQPEVGVGDQEIPFPYVLDAGHDLDKVLYTDDLVSGDDCFFVATGITDGELMQGVRYKAGGASTHSLVMRSRSGTIRSIHSEHKLSKLRAYADVDFER